MDCVHYGFKPVMGAQLLIDVVQMVTKGLLADVEEFCDLGLALPFHEDLPISGPPQFAPRYLNAASRSKTTKNIATR